MTQTVETYLAGTFAKKHVTNVLKHYSGMVEDFQVRRWEDCTAKAGKFVEAVLKALGGLASVSVPSPFKADTVVNGLQQAPGSPHGRTVHILVPRAARFIYDIASNRGARHDPDEIDPNEMDATISMYACSWMLAELVRHAQRGGVSLEDAKRAVDRIVARKHPTVERVEDRTHFLQRDLSAYEVAVLALNDVYPGRLSRAELLAVLDRHKFEKGNSRKALSRVLRTRKPHIVDVDAAGRLGILGPGRDLAEGVLRRGNEDSP